MKRAIGLALGLCFLVVAALHYNNPDTAVWVAICLIAAALCLMAAYGKAGRHLLIVTGMVVTAGAIPCWP